MTWWILVLFVHGVPHDGAFFASREQCEERRAFIQQNLNNQGMAFHDVECFAWGPLKRT